jgi:hypothetical protein
MKREMVQRFLKSLLQSQDKYDSLDMYQSKYVLEEYLLTNPNLNLQSYNRKRDFP